jgi:hypothetical protein
MDDSPKNETVPLFKGGALSTSMWITFVWTESKLIIDPFPDEEGLLWIPVNILPFLLRRIRYFIHGSAQVDFQQHIDHQQGKKRR